MEPIYYYKPRCALRMEVPSASDPAATTVVVTPSIISAKWTRNNHLTADELTVTVGWEEGGCDPRFLKNATCEFYMWDEISQEFTDWNRDFLRFVGICVKSARKLGETSSEVTLTFHDYTTLFIHMKPYPTSGMPEYSESLQEIWDKICDHVGTIDPSDDKKIISTVKDLRGKQLKVSPGVIKDGRTIGSIVSERFHAIDKPSIPQQASAWDVWMWVTTSLGYVSYIRNDECRVMTTTEHYFQSNAPSLIYGQNILEIEETSDASMSGKGILLSSYDPLSGRTLEAVYPLPGDERLKMTRAVAKRALKEGRDVSINDISGDYQFFEYHGIQTQAALDIRAKEAYEEYSRQQLEGTLKTAEMVIEDPDGDPFDILDLNANDPVAIGIDPDISKSKNEEEAYQKLILPPNNYNTGLARIIARNFAFREFQRPVFHVTSMDVDYKDGECMIEIKFHNLIHIKDGKHIAVPPIEIDDSPEDDIPVIKFEGNGGDIPVIKFGGNGGS